VVWITNGLGSLFSVIVDELGRVPLWVEMRSDSSGGKPYLHFMVEVSTLYSNDIITYNDIPYEYM